MENQKIKAVGYARVSSKMQEKEGFSIPAQIKLLDLRKILKQKLIINMKFSKLFLIRIMLN